MNEKKLKNIDGVCEGLRKAEEVYWEDSRDYAAVVKTGPLKRRRGKRCVVAEDSENV